MAVKNTIILQKMQEELTRAKKADSQTFIKHIEKIKLLCELFLDAEQHDSAPSSQHISKEEMKVMLGQQTKQPPIQHDEANGTSIFDF
ncbi:transcriptional regulator of met regulon [Cerasibacillus quisquiliarum]|uniref:YwdI family protein n=1 Tax=Cerasibacillus quisquiliarum TaxID=227865 RepID=A0A511V010_9BACI|nr:YwdI family protein [Cerasibacillus quisquiliarum]MBB5146022.1 transcriptional regulator of met regulon [Cerasibacillus quisquiliarum]GEN32199.1 hypothetical protein CQU01_24370 [Cerasibacillus quisquiliarum]